jgi:hypothetical protein
MPDPLEPGGKKTGPDFYAELLERSDEEEKKDQPESRNPPSESEKQLTEQPGEQKEKEKG